MPHGSLAERAALSFLLVVALVAFTVQFAVDQPVVGALGLLLLAVPGYAIGRALGPRPLGWPEVAFVTLGATLAITVLVGILAGLAPAGLDSRTIATLELPILVGICIAWLNRIFRGELATGAPRPRRPVAPATLLLVALGGIFAGTGLVIAARAAQAHPRPGFVQFWSLPARPSIGATVGIRNLEGVPLDCVVTIDRPDRDVLTWNAGTLGPGVTATTLLPQAEESEIAPWRLELECTGANGPVERRVSIDPPR